MGKTAVKPRCEIGFSAYISSSAGGELFHVCCNIGRNLDSFQYAVLSKETLEMALEVMRHSFFLHENVAVAVQLPEHPNAIKELEELSLRAARDGVSLVAIEKTSGRIVGVAFNKLQIKCNPGDELYFETYAAKCKEPSSKALVSFMKDLDESVNLFQHCNIDCLIEIMFLATLPDFRCKGIAKALCRATVDVAKALLKGDNVKHSINDEALPLEPTPKVVAAIFTSYISQKIGKALGFEKVIELGFDRWHFNGKTFAERIGPLTPCTTYEYKYLL